MIEITERPLVNCEPHKPSEIKTLWQHFRTAWRRASERRPFSLYLLLAILVVVLLGSQIVYVRDDPKRFALFLILNFVFFFVVILRAVVDFTEIVRGHVRARRQVFKNTLGDEAFVSELGRRVAEQREE